MKLGLMNDPKGSIYEQIAAFGEHGYEFVDLTMEGPDARTPDIERVREILAKYDLSVVGHTDPCLPYAYPIEEIRRACLAELERCAQTFSALGASVMNIHPSYACPPRMKRDLLKLNASALRPISEMANRYGLTLALENFKSPFDTVSTYETLLAEVPGLRVHLDLGHTNFGADDGVKFCKLLRDQIVHVHVSDNRSSGDHHMPLGVGCVNWQETLSALKATGYDGTITMEVFCNDHSVFFEYLEVSRSLLRDIWNRVN